MLFQQLIDLCISVLPHSKITSSRVLLPNIRSPIIYKNDDNLLTVKYEGYF